MVASHAVPVRKNCMHGWSGKNCRATPTKIIRVVFITHQRPLVSLVLLYTPSEDFAAGTMSHCSLLMVACALMLVSSRAVGASPDFESRWVDSKRDFDFDMITTSDGQHGSGKAPPPPPPPPDCSSNPCVHGSCAKPQGDTCDGGPSYVQQYVCAPPGSHI
jgi:hypothetical protein